MRFRNTALVSMLAFLLIDCVALLSLGFDQVFRRTRAMRAAFSEPAHPDCDPNIAGFAALIENIDTQVLVASMMIFNGLGPGLYNTVTD